NWEEIAVPPAGAGKGHYLTAVTMEGNEIIEIIDVERVLHDVNGAAGEAGIEDPVSFDALDVSECYVLVADDSAVARSQIKRTLDRLGVKYVLTKDGREALDTLERWVETDADELKKLALVISDVEMPVMDGYTLTTRIKNNPQLQRLKVLLHTSLSGVFDSSLTEKVAADGYLSKFDSDELVATVGKFVATFLEKLK
ncbi:MAG: response regulator, partial [Gammaproteobacteria bacterium]|nr:response regulator [Gammaproteobacteria bacterium]